MDNSAIIIKEYNLFDPSGPRYRYVWRCAQNLLYFTLLHILCIFIWILVQLLHHMLYFTWQYIFLALAVP